MIRFNAQNIPLPDLDYELVRHWIERVAHTHGFTVGNVSYLFCDDTAILETNRKFLEHDYFTDIITFDYTVRNRVGGDIVISLDTVESNAAKFSQPVGRELFRVIIHGILHLCGIDDKGPGEREIMEAHENSALLLLDSLAGADESAPTSSRIKEDEM